jgi:hypothetical protein
MFSGWYWTFFLIACLVIFGITGHKELEKRVYGVLESNIKHTSFEDDDRDATTSTYHTVLPIASSRAQKTLEDAIREAAVRFSSPAQKKRRRITPLQARTIAARQRWICPVCKKILDASFEIDHIKSLAHGGRDDDTNLQAIHKTPCHVWKTSMENRR